MAVNRAQNTVQKVQARTSDYESLVHPGKNAKMLNFAPKDEFAMASPNPLDAIRKGVKVASKGDVPPPPIGISRFRSS